MMKIMFVCTGNTCRSAMAECILKKLIKDEKIEGVKITSAGLNVTEAEMNSYARKALNELGVKPRKFLPKQITEKLLKSHNAIICMTKKHKDALYGFNNLYTVSELAKIDGDVIDPYGKDYEAYIETAKLLYKSCSIILNLIKEELKI